MNLLPYVWLVAVSALAAVRQVVVPRLSWRCASFARGACARVVLKFQLELIEANVNANSFTYQLVKCL